jgi:hypothetical protein
MRFSAGSRILQWLKPGVVYGETPVNSCPPGFARLRGEASQSTQISQKCERVLEKAVLVRCLIFGVRSGGGHFLGLFIISR